MASSLLQKMIPSHRVQHQIFRLVLYVALGTCLWMFIRLFNQQRVRNDAAAHREALKESKAVLSLANVRASFFICDQADVTQPEELDQCLTDPKQNVDMSVFLANSTRVPELKDRLGKPVQPNWAKVIFEISEEDRKWISTKSQVVLILPRNVHRATYVKTPRGFTQQFGFAADTTFSFTRDELLNLGRIELRMWLRNGLSFFGPADVPAVLARPEKVRDYSALIWMQKEAATLSRQFQLGIPVVLAAIAIVLDHSVVMSYLALYGASRAIHDFLGFKMDGGGIQLPLFEKYLYYMSCGFGFAFLVLFTATIGGLNVRRIKLAHRWLFVLVMGGLFGIGEFLDPSFSTTSDLWGDTLAIAASFCVLLYAGYEWLRYPPTAEMKISHPDSYSRVSVALVVTRLALVCAAFSIHGWVNARDLIGYLTKDASLKSPLDWKIMVLMPLLMTAALLEVGSTAKKMLTFGRDMAAKALIEQELNVGREVQARMLPQMKCSTETWTWRATYLPAEALAGDWFDIRELKFSDGRTLLAACVADVTGHGVGSSLATSVICSHWGLWCESLRSGDFPESSAIKQDVLRRAPYLIHMGLKALRENENCTAIFALLDPVNSEITFCSAGHPGIFCIGEKAFRYLTTQGERLGSDVLYESTWNAKTEKLNGDELVVLYSDGIVPLRSTVSSWAAQMKRKIAAGQLGSPEMHLVRQLRLNKEGFRSAQELVDDMTLVMVRRKSSSQHKSADDVVDFHIAG